MQEDFSIQPTQGGQPTQTRSYEPSEEFKKIRWTNAKRKVSDLKFHPKNPRVITEDKIKRMRKSFEDYGYADPVMVNMDNVLISGHARVSTLLADDKGEEEIDVRLPNRLLTDKEHEGLLLTMNRMGDNAWDWDTLANEYDMEFLREAGFTDVDFDGFKIDDEELVVEDVVEEDKEEKVERKLREVSCPHCNRLFEVEL